MRWIWWVSQEWKINYKTKQHTQYNRYEMQG